MARIWQTGFELNDTTGKEGFTVSGSNPPTISTVNVRTGTYALRQQGGTGSTADFQFASADSNGPYYVRAYLFVATYPSAAASVTPFFLASASFAGVQPGISLNTNGAIQLIDGNGGQIGSDGPILTQNTWYQIEMYFKNNTVSGKVEITAYLNGVSFASTTTYSTNLGGVSFIHLGNGGGAATVDIYLDDVAINDSIGPFQNNLPGSGQITHSQPNAAGDNNAWTVQVGGTAGSANNYTRVKEVTPDDATSYNGDTVSGHTDDFKMIPTPASIGPSDTINCIMVGIRYRAVVASAETAFKVRYKKASSGTVNSSGAITPNSTTFTTNANAAPKLYPIIAYQDPDGGVLTKAKLDTSQIGYTVSTVGTNATDITTIWLSIDSTPNPNKPNPLLLMGVGA